MEALVECVPNFSEGSDPTTLDALAQAVRRPGAWLLDTTSDADHARSVLTFAGPMGPVLDAAEAAVGIAVERIDMRSQRGQHPRIGAADVVPLVPLGASTMASCIDGARRLAASVAERFELPVYLYAESAQRPERRILANIRRPGYEGLASWMAEPGHEPDFGPRRPHPTAGASVIGARRVLIAFNIQLATPDVAIARRIAARLRERDGGLPAVQALGIELHARRCAQVSMNLLDHTRTPLWRVWERVERLALAEGVSPLDSEVIGLLPTAALSDVADHIGVASSDPLEDRLVEAAAWLRIRGFEPDMTIELRLARRRAPS